MSYDSLVYVGKIISLEPIEGADFIVSATVVCGEGGKWRGVIRKVDFAVGDECVVFLPDSLLNENDHFYMPFMKESGWRVKMRRFKGAPSEVVIMKHLTTIAYHKDEVPFKIGDDVTERLRVSKYHKPVPAHLQGKAKGYFPGFIPKTDELNYQQHGDLVDHLVGMPYYITEKCDGSSTTAYRYKGQFGICSRNLELERDATNGYWQVALKYGLEDNLMEGYALQWETCGPGIQSNPMGLKEIDGFAFSGYKIDEHRYLEFIELQLLCSLMGFPMCKILDVGDEFSKDGIEFLGEGLYDNKKPREGVVVRSRYNVGSTPISFKVINLDYDK